MQQGILPSGSSTGRVLCITLPPTGRNFIISGCISSPLIWDQVSGVTGAANQRPVLAPLTNETPTPSDEADAAFVIFCTRSFIFLNLNSFVKFAQNTNNQSMKELQTMKLNHVDVYNAYYEGRGEA